MHFKGVKWILRQVFLPQDQHKQRHNMKIRHQELIKMTSYKEKTNNMKRQKQKCRKRNIFDCDIRRFHMGIQLPNGEKKGAQVVVRHKKQNGIMDVRAMLKNGVRLTSCTCEARGGYRQQLTDSEMVALFGKENVITKEARRKAEAQKRWEKHCIKKGWEIRPPAEKYL